MKLHTLRQELTLEQPLEKVYDFFANPENLERITPPWLRFRIVSPQPVQMKQGATIDYKLRIHGIPIRWTSQITDCKPPFRFVDEQLKGPYKVWIHEHIFEPGPDGGTKIIDKISYAAAGGSLINNLFVRPDLRRIFQYRSEKIVEILGGVPLDVKAHSPEDRL